jgi:hypothetical protein
VEWFNAVDIDLEIDGQAGSADKKASLSVYDTFFFWF